MGIEEMERAEYFAKAMQGEFAEGAPEGERIVTPVRFLSQDEIDLMFAEIHPIEEN